MPTFWSSDPKKNYKMTIFAARLSSRKLQNGDFLVRLSSRKLLLTKMAISWLVRFDAIATLPKMTIFRPVGKKENIAIRPRIPTF